MFPYFYTPVYYKPFFMEILSHMENFTAVRRKPVCGRLCLLQAAFASGLSSAADDSRGGFIRRRAHFPGHKNAPGNLPGASLSIFCYWAAVIVFTISAIAPASDMVQLVAKITIKLSCFLQ